MEDSTHSISIPKIDETLSQLKKHTNEAELEPLISVLEALREDIDNESLLKQLTETWRELGVYQGMVLTFVPYFYTIIPDDIFGDNL